MAYATQQKRVLSRILEETQAPLTAQQLLAQAQQEQPGLGMATVYRALKQFQAKGLVRTVEIPGVTPHYESVNHRHHHFFVCESCKRLFNLIGCLAGVDTLAPAGFETTRHEIVLYGTCQECVEARSSTRVE